jgi:hypothetical protein
MKNILSILATPVFTHPLKAQTDTNPKDLINDYLLRLFNLAKERSFRIHFLIESDQFNDRQLTKAYKFTGGKNYILSVMSA